MRRITVAILLVVRSRTCGWRRRSSRRVGIASGIAGCVLGDVVPFHAAFGRDRFVDGRRSERGTLDREQLLEGAGRLLGPWFADAYADDRAPRVGHRVRDRW